MPSLWWQCSARSEGEFSAQTSLVCCNKEKMWLSIHALVDGNLGGEISMPFTDTNAIPASVTHAHICTHIPVINSAMDRREEREALRRVFPLLGTVVEQSGQAGLSSVVTERRYLWHKGGFFRIREGQIYHYQCLMSFITHHQHQLHEILHRNQRAAEETGDMRTGTGVRNWRGHNYMETFYKEN